MADVVFFKNPGILSFERQEFQKLLVEAREHFIKISEEEEIKYAYAVNLKSAARKFFTVSPPSFWIPEMSFLFDSVDLGQTNGQPSSPQPARMQTKEELYATIKTFAAANPKASERQLAKMFGVSSGTVHNILKDYPYRKKPVQ